MGRIFGFFKWFFSDKDNSQYEFMYDETLIFASLSLLVIGLLMVYSASIAYASNDVHIHNQFYYFNRHLTYVILGLIFGGMTASINSEFWRKNAIPISCVILFLLVAVLIPHVGRVVNGSRRWIGFGIANIQPSELAKLGISVFMSFFVTRKNGGIEDLKKDLLPALGVLVVMSALLLKEPDMGSTTVVCVIALIILIMADIKRIYLFSLMGMGASAFIILVITTPYRLKRVTGFADPWRDAFGKGYQLTHSLLAVSHGSWFGVGLGNSIEKLFYLPEAHTDFILAIVAEETGFVGIIVILILYWIIFYRGFWVIGHQAHENNRKFQALLAQGISTWIFIQALVNIGVVIGALPTKGLTLPLVSFGGSSIITTCIALALLLRIGYENKAIKKGLEV